MLNLKYLSACCQLATSSYVTNKFFNAGDVGGIDLWFDPENANYELGDLLQDFGKLVYGGIIFFSVIFGGYKLVSSFIAYFGTSPTNTQLKLQYKNDIKEVITGYLMLILGTEIVANIMSAVFPESQGIGIINEIKNADKQQLATNFTGKMNGSDNVVSLGNQAFILMQGFGIAYFAFTVVKHLLEFFKADSVQKKEEAKESMKMNILGILALMMASEIYKAITGQFGLSEIFFSN